MRLLSFIPIVFLLAGCAVGPDYKRPVVEAPADWRWKKAEPRDAQNKGPWWELFNDSELNRLETEAIANNQNLKAAFARLDQSRAQARISRADLFPTISADPTWSRYRTSPSRSGGFNAPASTNNDFKFPFDLSYEIDLWGKVRRAFESARNEMLADAADYQNVLFTLQADVAMNYFQLRSTDQEIEMNKQAVKLRQELLQITQDRFHAGYSSELDIASVQTELSSAKATLADAHRRRAEYQNALAVLCGKPTGVFEIASAPISWSAPQISAGLPSELLERRPDVAEAERKLAARNAEIGVAQAAFFPSIRLTAEGGFQSFELQDIFNWENRIWSFGPSISIPIFSGDRNKAHLESAKAAYEEAVAQYRQSILTAFQEVDDALAGLRFLEEQVIAQKEAVQFANLASEIATTRYKNGVSDYLGVIDAEKNRLSSELQALQANTQHILAAIALIKAIGGGWNTKITEEK